MKQAKRPTTKTKKASTKKRPTKTTRKTKKVVIKVETEGTEKINKKEKPMSFMEFVKSWYNSINKN